MGKTEQLLEEYKMLRTEILFFMKKDTTMLTCLFSGVTAVLFFALEIEMPEGCFLAYLIIIPICSKLAYHQKQMAKISTYISFFLEKELDIKWETYVLELSKLKDRPRQGKLLKFSECTMMAIATLMSFMYLVIQNNIWENRKFLFFIEMGLMIFLFITVLVKNRKIYCIKSYRKKYEEKAKNLNLEGEDKYGANE